MIEVEKKFQPTEEQLEPLLKDANFLREELIQDTYYDYSDYRLLKQGIRLRNRNGSFELKKRLRENGSTHEEITDKEEIKKYFSTNQEIEGFVNDNFQKIIEYTTKRKKYTKDGFSIDVDELSFGLNVCEIELIVDKVEQTEEAKEKILEFAKKYNFEIKKMLSKGAEYLCIFNPKIFEEIYGEKLKEIKMK